MWDEIARLNSDGHTVFADVDSIELLRGYEAAAAKFGTSVTLRVQVDSGLRGCRPIDAAALCAAALTSPHLRLWGLTAYRSLYARDETRNWTPFDVIGRQEGRLLADLRDSIESRLGCHHLGVLTGSTAIAQGSMAADGVDEVAGASYVLNDWGLAQLGLCETSDIAVGVAATVVAVEDNTVTIDAGSATFGRWDPYPGIEQPVSAATPDGLITFTATGPCHSMSLPVEARRVPQVGERIFVYPGHVSELVNVPGSFLAYDDTSGECSEWTRLSSGYYSLDDDII
ncbi:hypothetical protein ASG84_25730 [Rhodococcus sp. Leaf278]|uniref:hypothetical protein n=1 Tax=Rhodococcus sp. Leaf278 TaxID=1736319 RepID=UPI00071120A9|nr:hypothetical protein [Rhodococcus sp. Leaf278]KQU51501.1 hypothetical protein ASG84_25730 [Rhodococcus sp. Leaf278]